MQNEYVLFLIFLLIGIILGMFVGILNSINIIFNNKRVIRIITDIIVSISLCVTFFGCIIKLDIIEFRFYLICAFCLGIIVERISLGKLFAKLAKLLYTLVNKGANKFTQSPLGKAMLK